MMKQYCVIAEDGSIRRLTISEDGVIVPPRDALAAFLPPEWIPVPVIQTRMGQNLHMSVRRGGAYMVGMPLDSIEVKAKWRKTEQDGESYLSPWINEGTPPPDVNPAEVSRTFKAPSTMGMFIGLLCVGTGTAAIPYFFWRRRSDGQWFRPPLSNLYDCGKVCMGPGNYLRGNNVQELILNTAEVFFSSPFGSHMAPPENAMGRWVRYKIEKTGNAIVQVAATPEMVRQLKVIDTEQTQALTAALNINNIL
jgi:hypothetical protein